MVVKALACFFWEYLGNLRRRSVTNDTLQIFEQLFLAFVEEFCCSFPFVSEV